MQTSGLFFVPFVLACLSSCGNTTKTELINSIQLWIFLIVTASYYFIRKMFAKGLLNLITKYFLMFHAILICSLIYISLSVIYKSVLQANYFLKQFFFFSSRIFVTPFLLCHSQPYKKYLKNFSRNFCQTPNFCHSPVK